MTVPSLASLRVASPASLKISSIASWNWSSSFETFRAPGHRSGNRRGLDLSCVLLRSLIAPRSPRVVYHERFDGQVLSTEDPELREPVADVRATFWLSPVSLRDARGYTPREIERIRRIVIGSREMRLRRWHEYFDHLA